LGYTSFRLCDRLQTVHYVSRTHDTIPPGPAQLVVIDLSKTWPPMPICDVRGASELVSHFFTVPGTALDMSYTSHQDITPTVMDRTERTKQTWKVHQGSDATTEDMVRPLQLAEFAYPTPRSATPGSTPFIANKALSPKTRSYPERD